MNILEDIIRYKKKEIKSRKEMIPGSMYEGVPAFRRNRASFAKALNNSCPSVIAEFKRKSPSKGTINNIADLYDTITGYTRAGVNAISVITDNPSFGGSLCDLQDASLFTSLPLLRKDFIIDEYQVLETKAFGASAILLIASTLRAEEIKNLTLLAHEIGLDVLFEIHDEKDMDKWCPEIKIIGVNNRNLETFRIDIDNSLKLLKLIPAECIKVAESGITEPKIIFELYRSGFNAFLIGEAFMKTGKPWVAAGVFMNRLKKRK